MSIRVYSLGLDFPHIPRNLQVMIISYPPQQRQQSYYGVESEDCRGIVIVVVFFHSWLFPQDWRDSLSLLLLPSAKDVVFFVTCTASICVSCLLYLRFLSYRLFLVVHASIFSFIWISIGVVSQWSDVSTKPWDGDATRGSFVRVCASHHEVVLCLLVP